MNLRSRRWINEASSGVMAALIAIAFAFAAAFVIPNRLWSSRWFWFSMLTAGVFITSGVSLGTAVRLRMVQKRLLMLMGAHILIGLPIVLLLRPSVEPKSWIFVALFIVETSLIRRLTTSEASDSE